VSGPNNEYIFAPTSKPSSYFPSPLVACILAFVPFTRSVYSWCWWNRCVMSVWWEQQAADFNTHQPCSFFPWPEHRYLVNYSTVRSKSVCNDVLHSTVSTTEGNKLKQQLQFGINCLIWHWWRNQKVVKSLWFHVVHKKVKTFWSADTHCDCWCSTWKYVLWERDWKRENISELLMSLVWKLPGIRVQWFLVSSNAYTVWFSR
jgi:hypothetical protein